MPSIIPRIREYISVIVENVGKILWGKCKIHGGICEHRYTAVPESWSSFFFFFFDHVPGAHIDKCYGFLTDEFLLTSPIFLISLLPSLNPHSFFFSSRKCLCVSYKRILHRWTFSISRPVFCLCLKHVLARKMSLFNLIKKKIFLESKFEVCFNTR